MYLSKKVEDQICLEEMLRTSMIKEEKIEDKNSNFFLPFLSQKYIDKEKVYKRAKPSSHSIKQISLIHQKDSGSRFSSNYWSNILAHVWMLRAIIELIVTF